ncbi:hypothetical protein V6N13_032498 [Hibiscus sabdariffa]|uniref:HMA domain-containing protein n=1 Tax=Hibiscus sabdariffa TaxID=183260 RepID=A0ABR2NER8_9ROSI
MKTICGLSGVESISFDAKDQTLTVVGDIDPVKAVGKLMKLCRTEIISVGPAKGPEPKKEEPKKEEPKKEEPKKEEPPLRYPYPLDRGEGPGSVHSVCGEHSECNGMAGSLAHICKTWRRCEHAYSRGGKKFGFVRFEKKLDAERVIERLNGFTSYGFRLTVKMAKYEGKKGGGRNPGKVVRQVKSG